MKSKRLVYIGSIILWFCFLLLSIFPNIPGLDEDSNGEESLMDSVMILNERDSAYNLDEILELSDHNFILFDDSEYKGMLSSSTYWFKVTLDSVSEGSILEIGKPHLSQIVMYQLTIDGDILKINEKGRSLPVSNHLIKYPNFAFELIPSDQPVILVLEVEADTYLQLPTSLWNQSAFVNHIASSYLLEGLFFGMLLIMLVYNLILGLAIKDRTYFLLVGMIAGYTIIQGVWSGLAYVFIWPGAHYLDLSANPISIAFTTVFLAWFTKEFLGVNNTYKKMKWLMRIVMLICAIGFVATILGQIQLGIYIAMVAVLVAMVYVLITISIKGVETRAVQIYIIAWEAFLAGNLMNILSGFGLIDYTAFVMLAPRIGAILLVALFSLALADRINSIEYQRGKADEKSNILSELHDINKKITGTRDIRRLVNHLILSYTAMTRAEDGFVVLSDPSELRDIRIYRPNTSEWSMHIDGDAEKSFSYLLESNKVTYAKVHEVNYLQLDKWVEEVMIIPIVNYDVPIGLIVLMSSGTLRVSESVEKMTLDYANQVAINIGNIKLLDEVTKSSRTDSLTGMHNRRYLIELANKYCNIYNHELPLSVMMIDIDHFKIINDTYGHQIGDQILMQIAHRLMSVVQKYGEIGRYGGEEFIAFFPGLLEEQGSEVADQMRSIIGDGIFDIDYNGKLSLEVTVSIGVSYRNDIKDTINILIDRADQALYQAKQRGRNQYSIY